MHNIPTIMTDWRPRNERALLRFVNTMLGLRLPDAPAAYLAHSFFEKGDALVWANRGGGKTVMGAVATLLDMVFKPGIQVRILAGSREQSQHMYTHLVQMFDKAIFRPLLENAPTQRGFTLGNGSAVELLAQSHRSVRGTRVHKLRCDEVELFEEDVWQAAQMITRSGKCGEVHVKGSIEAFSTMHQPFGLMSKLLDDATAHQHTQVFRWHCLDVIETCPPARDCAACPLSRDCQGQAKQATGFMPVDDLIRQMQRTDRQSWESEMLCERPRTHDCVYPQFRRATHVQAEAQRDHQAIYVGGMDLGIRSPLVLLLAAVQEHVNPLEARVHVLDEYIANNASLYTHLDALAGKGWPAMQWIGVDPASRQRSMQTGRSDFDILKQYHYRPKTQRQPIHTGIARIRRRLEQETLHIHPRCAKLIHAMQTYHFDTTHRTHDQPIKDGPDHACDALRYLIDNLEVNVVQVVCRSYL